MPSMFSEMELITESDVEQKFILKLLTEALPTGLGYKNGDFKTKANIKRISIDKGNKKHLYFPDYAVIIDGLPLLIIEAKTPGSDLKEAMREARLYATEINASYPRNVNPCERILATDGRTLLAGYWDSDEYIIEIASEEFTAVSPDFLKLTDFAAHPALTARAREILGSIKSAARYFKPLHMLGGKAVINETIGDNSFGTNVSIEYKYLFNPDSPEDRASIVHHAYVTSKRKQAHVAPIDKLIRAAMPRNVVDAREIEDSRKPTEVLEAVGNIDRVKNEICLLIGSVGSGKSTFTDYLRLEALPAAAVNATDWVNLNLNKAPLSRELIYEWIVAEIISAIAKHHSKIDFSEISFLKKIYAKQLAAVERGKASLYPKDSEKYIDAIFNEIDKLQESSVATLAGIIDYLYKSNNKLLVVVLDNCDKRNREDQLLMFEVASWLKNTFICMVFLPLRDTTYDQYHNEPPLDTVIKDLVFRIDPPLLERVIYARLSYALREIDMQNNKFSFFLPNGMRVDCARSEVGLYLKSMVASLFQDQLFRRIISGLAGRNIRKGLEILLDFCKSGYIGADQILKIRASDGDYHLPPHLIARILLKGKRKYYSDTESNVRNLFASDDSDPLPNPFVRIAVLQWLKNRAREYGPNRTLGFHQIATLVSDLQTAGYPEKSVIREIMVLTSAECIRSEAQTNEISPNDLVAIGPAGHVHLDLLRNINYLSTVAEDVLFRENQVAKAIADNVVGRGKFRTDSRQTAINNAALLTGYLTSYYEKYFLGEAKLVYSESTEQLVDIPEIELFVKQQVENDDILRNVGRLEAEYPVGSQLEAQIVSVQDYGVFVEFGLDGSGLVHKSNFNGVKTDTIDALEAGDWVTVQILKYNHEHRKFDLKLVAVSDIPQVPQL
ncbi:type I restriction endonuclease (plasmid) [Paraburkholderia sp. PREW-6R]|uniref:type I restriction endonuclease n=1 Tax=Paraburkholderia sp. PREW-6R TaxID=3141544 RepID=UPI0031F52ECF